MQACGFVKKRNLFLTKVMITLSACRNFISDTMGMCLSCCPRDSDSESVGPDGDRTRLINGEVLPVGDASYGREEEDDLNEIPYGSVIDPNRSKNCLKFSVVDSHIELLSSDLEE